MNEIENIKNELISLYKSLKNDLPEDTFSSFSFEQGIVDIPINFSPISLIQKIKEIVNNNKYNESNEELLKNYHQLESQIKKNEYDIKYYISELMTSKIKIISLQIKLNAYMTIENELEELKAKIKYEDGKFLENDRKDNEILILRKENTKIKKQLSFYELKHKKFEDKNIKYKNKIHTMENEIKSLNKKINELESKIKQSESKTRNVRINNITIHSSTSKHDLKAKTNDMDNNIISKLDNQKYTTIKYMRNKHYKNSSDMNYLSNIYSPNRDYFLFDNYNNKSTYNKIFDSTYNNILNSFNKKIKLPLKRDFSNFMKQKKSNSVSRILNYENDGDNNILNKSHKKRKNLINTSKAGTKKKFLIKSLKM